MEKVKLSKIFAFYWRGMKKYKLAMWLGILGYFVGNLTEVVVPLYYKRFFDVVSSKAASTEVAAVLVGIIFAIFVISVIRWCFYRIGSYSNNYFEAKVMALLRQQAFDYTLDHSHAFFADTFTGSLVQKIGRYVRAFERFFDTFIYNLLPLVVYISGVLIILWQNQKQIALYILCWAVAILTFSILYSRWKLKFDVASAAADSRSSGRLADVITNQNNVSAFTAHDFESAGFKEVTNEQARATLLTWNWGELTNTVQGAFIIAIEFLVFYFGIKYWVAGKITVGTFVLIQVYILGLSNRLWGLNNIVRSVYESLADSKEMVEILRLPHAVSDIENAQSLVVSKGEIEFKNVEFNFDANRPILRNVSLTIKPGEKVALIGPSGAGKSTIVKLLTRTHNLAQGEISVDGQDIQKVTQESLRANISLVPQDPILFHRSLMENIRYGRRDATDAEVVEAARLAHCDEFIETLPDGYKTFVGERGIKLSGGERQRVAIARAILKNAPILVLDEATSSLDSHSEALIQDALDKLMQGRTSIVIAHRLSTIRKMDRIIVVKNGAIEEEGTHDDLVKRDESLYKTLWNLQAGGFITE